MRSALEHDFSGEPVLGFPEKSCVTEKIEIRIVSIQSDPDLERDEENCARFSDKTWLEIIS